MSDRLGWSEARASPQKTPERAHQFLERLAMATPSPNLGAV